MTKNLLSTLLICVCSFLISLVFSSCKEVSKTGSSLASMNISIPDEITGVVQFIQLDTTPLEDKEECKVDTIKEEVKLIEESSSTPAINTQLKKSCFPYNFKLTCYCSANKSCYEGSSIVDKSAIVDNNVKVTIKLTKTDPDIEGPGSVSVESKTVNVSVKGIIQNDKISDFIHPACNIPSSISFVSYENNILYVRLANSDCLLQSVDSFDLKQEQTSSSNCPSNDFYVYGFKTDEANKDTVKDIFNRSVSDSFVAINCSTNTQFNYTKQSN